MTRRWPILASASLLAAVLPSPWSAEAVTRTQSAIAEQKPRLEAEKRRKLDTLAKRNADRQGRQQADVQLKAKSVTQSRLNVHIESRRRLEATRKAAEAHARIVAAQLKATHGPAGHHLTGRTGKGPRRPLHHSAGTTAATSGIGAHAANH